MLSETAVDSLKGKSFYFSGGVWSGSKFPETFYNLKGHSALVFGVLLASVRLRQAWHAVRRTCFDKKNKQFNIR